MENNFYEVVKNNGKLENELKIAREKESNEAANVLQKGFYSKYKFLMKEFICFINDIATRYGNINSKLENIRLSEVKVTYSKFDNDYILKVVHDFVKNNDLGEIKYGVIVWNEGKTIKDFINAYYFELQRCEQYIFIKSDLKTQYIQLLEENIKEYESLITDKFKDFVKLYAKGINENVSYKVYYYLQQKLEERNYDLQEYETRDFSDLSYYDDPVSWDYCNPDNRFPSFLGNCDISGVVSNIIEGKTTLNLNTVTKHELELLIRDIMTVPITKEVKNDEPTLSRGKAYKDVYTKYKN